MSEKDVDIGLEISSKLFADLQRLQKELKSVEQIVSRMDTSKGLPEITAKMQQESKMFLQQMKSIKTLIDSYDGGPFGMSTPNAMLRQQGMARLQMTYAQAFKAQHANTPLTSRQVQGMSMSELTQTKKLVGQLVSEALAQGDKQLAESHRQVGQQMAEQLRSMQTLLQKQTVLQNGNLAAYNRMGSRDYQDRRQNELINRALDKRTSSGGIAATSRGRVTSLDAALGASPTERKRIMEAQKQLFDSALAENLKIPKSVQDQARQFYHQMEAAFKNAEKAGRDLERKEKYIREGRTSSIAQDFKDAELRKQAVSRQTLTGLTGVRDLDVAKERIRRQEFRAGEFLNYYQKSPTPELKEQLALEAKSLQQLKDWVAETKRAQQASKERHTAHKQELQERAKIEQEAEKFAAQLKDPNVGASSYRRQQRNRYFQQPQTTQGLLSSGMLEEAQRRLEGQRSRVGAAELRLSREQTAANQDQLASEQKLAGLLENRVRRLQAIKIAEEERAKAAIKAQQEAEKFAAQLKDPNVGASSYRRQQRNRYFQQPQTTQGLLSSGMLEEGQRRLEGQRSRVGAAELRLSREQTAANQDQLASEQKLAGLLENRVRRLQAIKIAEEERAKAAIKAQQEAEREEARLNQADYAGTLYRRNERQRYFIQRQGIYGLWGSNDLGEAKRRLEGQRSRVGAAEARLEKEVTAENVKQLELERNALRAIDNRISRLKTIESLEKAQTRAQEKARNDEKAWETKNDPDYLRRNAEYQRRSTNERLFGDGGANLIGIQASLMAHYALLSGVQNMFSGSANFVLELDKGLRQLQSIVRITDNDMDSLGKRLIDISEITKFTALEVVQAATVLGQAGFGKRQIEESMEAVTLFATAVGTDLGSAVDLATSAMGVFNKDADQMSVMVNQMTTAVNTSKLNLDKLTLGLQYAGNTAHQSNVPFEELIATLGAMANSGIKSGSTLGTGLRQILITLQKPSDQFKTQMKDLGITMDQLDLNTHGLVGVMTTLAEKGFTVTDAMKTMEVRAAAAYGAFANNLDVAKDMLTNLDDHTAAGKANETQMKALANQLDRLRSASLSMVNEGAKPTVSVLTQMVTKLADAAGSAQNFGNALAFVGTAATMLVGGGLLGWLGRLGGGLLRGNPLVRASTALAGNRKGLAWGIGGAATFAGATGGAYGYHQLSQANALANRVDQTQTTVDNLGSDTERLQGYSDRVSDALEDIWNKRHQLEEDGAFQAMVSRMQTEFEKVGLVLDSSVTSVDGLIEKLKDLKISLDDEYQLKVTLEQSALAEALDALREEKTTELETALQGRTLRADSRRYRQEFNERLSEAAKRTGRLPSNYNPEVSLNDQIDDVTQWEMDNPERRALTDEAWALVERAKRVIDLDSPMDRGERDRELFDVKAMLGSLEQQIADVWVKVLDENSPSLVKEEFRALTEALKSSREGLGGIVRLENKSDQTISKAAKLQEADAIAEHFKTEAQSLKEQAQDVILGLQRGDYSDDPLAKFESATPQLARLGEQLEQLIQRIRDENPELTNMVLDLLNINDLSGRLKTQGRELQEGAEPARKRVLSVQEVRQNDARKLLSYQFENANNLDALDELYAQMQQAERDRVNTETTRMMLKATPGGLEAQNIQADQQLKLAQRLEALERSYQVSRDVITGNIDYSLAGAGAEFDEKLSGLVQNKVLYPFMRSLEALDSSAKEASEAAKTKAEDAADRRQTLTDSVGVEGLSRDERATFFDQALQAMAEEAQYSRQALQELKGGNEEQLRRLETALAEWKDKQSEAGEFTRTGQQLGKAIERGEAEQAKLQAELAKNTRQLEQNTRSSAQQTQELRRMRNLDQYQGSNYQSAAYRQRRAEFGRSGVAGLGDTEFHDSRGDVRTAGQGGWAATFDGVAQSYEGIDALTELSIEAEEIMSGLAGNMANMWMQVAQGAMSAEDAMKNMIMNVAAQLVQSQLAGLFGQLIGAGASALGGYFGGGFDMSTASSYGSYSMSGGNAAAGMGAYVSSWQGGEVKGYYGGGVITSGRGDRDSTYIKAAKGEFVVRREAVKAVGLDTLETLNRMDQSTIKTKAAASSAGKAETTSQDSGIQEVNVYVVSKEAVPQNLGPNDVVAIISDDLARGGKTKKLIQQINARHI